MAIIHQNLLLRKKMNKINLKKRMEKRMLDEYMNGINPPERIFKTIVAEGVNPPKTVIPNQEKKGVNPPKTSQPKPVEKPKK